MFNRHRNQSDSVRESQFKNGLPTRVNLTPFRVHVYPEKDSLYFKLKQKGNKYKTKIKSFIINKLGH